MSKKHPKHRRVALLNLDRVDMAPDMLRGIVAYRAHAPHWQLRGQAVSPFVDWESATQEHYDGLIALYDPDAAGPHQLGADTKVVDIGDTVTHSPYPRAHFDGVAEGRMGATHLLERGYANFAFFERPGAWYSRQILQGFRQVIEDQAGHTCHSLDAPWIKADERHDALVAWLAQLPRPIGIMAPGDHLASVVIRTAQELGLRVPDDAGVLGVGDSRIHQVMSPVPLSTVARDAARVGFLAAGLLDDLMEGRAPRQPEAVKPRQVIKRMSTDVVVAQDPLVSRALAYMREQCGRGIGVEDVVDTVGVSRRTLEHRMKRSIGQTPQAAIFNAQVELAKKLLTTTDRTIEQIAYDSGFPRPARLSETFKRITGLTPGRYRQRFGERHAAPQ